MSIALGKGLGAIVGHHSVVPADDPEILAEKAALDAAEQISLRTMRQLLAK